MRAIVLILSIGLLSACDEQHDVHLNESSLKFGDRTFFPKPPAKESFIDEKAKDEEKIVPKVSGVKELSLESDGYPLDITVSESEITIVSLPPLFKVPLQMRTFQRVSVINDTDALKDTCIDMRYRTQKFQAMTGIKAKALINPFATDLIGSSLAMRGFSFERHDLKGSFDAVSITTEIIAPFLNEDEIQRLKLWFLDQLKIGKKRLNFIIAGSLDFDKPELIMELARLICGILEQEAHIDFILKDKDNHTLTARMDEIKFVVY